MLHGRQMAPIAECCPLPMCLTCAVVIIPAQLCMTLPTLGNPYCVRRNIVLGSSQYCVIMTMHPWVSILNLWSFTALVECQSLVVIVWPVVIPALPGTISTAWTFLKRRLMMRVFSGCVKIVWIDLVHNISLLCPCALLNSCMCVWIAVVGVVLVTCTCSHL